MDILTIILKRHFTL